MNKNFIIIMVMCASRLEARRIADRLLKKRLVACSNILSGVDSKFWWKGKVDSAREALLMMKTKKDKFSIIEKEIKRIHSYEVPEIIALPVIAGSKNYLNWIRDSVK